MPSAKTASVSTPPPAAPTTAGTAVDQGGGHDEDEDRDGTGAQRTEERGQPGPGVLLRLGRHGGGLSVVGRSLTARENYHKVPDPLQSGPGQVLLGLVLRL